MTEYAMMTQRIISGGINMAKRNRYRELESLMTKVILGEAAVFILYMIFAYNELIALKVITAIITIVGAPNTIHNNRGTPTTATSTLDFRELIFSRLQTVCPGCDRL